MAISVFLSAEDQIVPVPLYLDGEYSGEIDIRIQAESVYLQAFHLLEFLEDDLSQQVLDQNRDRWGVDQWIAIESLSASRILNVVFDETQLIMKIDIPPESKKLRYISLTGSPATPDKRVTYPAQLSGIVNMEGWGKVIYEEPSFDYQLGPELVVQYEGYILEARVGIHSEDELFYYDYFRGIKDFPEMNYRVEAGDLSYSAGGFLPSPMVGFSGFRKTSLDQSYQSTPKLGRTIFFSEPADVEIIINERVASRQRVPAGTWTFESFPLVQGANEVVIEWTNTQGVYRDEFFQIYDGELLKEGEYDLGAALGTDSYTSLNPALLLHMNTGVTDTLTIGVNFYYDMNKSYYALESPMVHASPWGTFTFVPALDIYMEEGMTTDFDISHTYSEKRKDRLNYSVGSSLGYQANTGTSPSQRFNMNSYLNYSPVSGLSFTPSASWIWLLTESLHNYDFKVRVRKSSSDGSTISAEVGAEYDDGEWNPTASITYSASFPDIQQNFYIRGDVGEEKMNMNWSRYPVSGSQSDYSLGAAGSIPADNEERITFSFNGGYVHPLFTARLTQGFNGFLATEEYNNSTTLNFGSALVYVDEVIGFSRPIQGSFVLVQSDIGPLEVNPTRDGPLLALDGVTPGVISSLSAYRYTTLKLVPESLPVGSDINDYTTIVYPIYRSGTLLRVEEKIFMYAGGILLDSGNQPIALQLGRIEPYPGSEPALFEEVEWPREFFTDSTGYFESYSLTPGVYLLTQEEKGLTYKIEVPMNESGFCDLGEVTPEN